MEKIQIEKIGTIAIVGMIFLSGMMMMPTTVEAKNDLPDLAVRNIAWRSPVQKDELLPVTIYIENIGNAPVDCGFWIEVNYAEFPGFWQEAAESHNIWVNPPIKEGQCRAVEFTTIALNSECANFEVSVDTTNEIIESNEYNNVRHRCSIAIGVAPNTSFTTQLFLRNEMLFTDSFIIEINPTTLPDGWGFLGGIPPSTITAQPGGNIILSETVIVPNDATLNARIQVNATRVSDGDFRFVEIYVITSPEIGIYFTPYTNELIVSGSSYLGHYLESTSTLITDKGIFKITKYTVTDDNGRYISATIQTIHTKLCLKYTILEFDYNGVVSIPAVNDFQIIHLIDNNNELKQYNQKMNYEKSIMYSDVRYNSKDDVTTMVGETPAGSHDLLFNGIASLSVRTWNSSIIPMRLDTNNYQTWAIGIPGFCCWIDCPLLMSM